MSCIVRAVAWTKDDPFGVEFAQVELAPDRLTAAGVAIGSDPVPYRLDYTLETAAGFITSRLQVTARGQGWRRGLDLRRTAAGIWCIETEEDGDAPLGPSGGNPALFAGALDCDLALSPLTNAMPVLRRGLLTSGGPVEFLMAWISVPDLSVRPDGQRYTFVRTNSNEHVVRFDATDGAFTADIVLDADGIVLDYPGIAHRLR